MLLRKTPMAIALAVAMHPPVLKAEEPARARVDPTTAELSAVVVRAAKPAQAAPFAAGQVSKSAGLGAMGTQALIDTPFSITSYTAQLIRDQQARTLADVMQNDPSVRFTTSSGHAYENYRIRGFDVSANDLAINGMYGLAPYGHTPVEFIEQVEVLKGPSALFSGMAPSGGVGGVINLVPKRAADAPLTRATIGYQSDAQAMTALDVGRRFGEDNEWGLRVNHAYSNGDTGLDGQSKKRDFVSAALDYRGRQLKASLDTYYSKEAFSGGTPAMYWFATSSMPAAPDAGTNLFPNAYGTLESQAAILRGEYALDADLSVFAGLGTMHHEFSGFINGTHARSIQANGDFSGRMVAQRGYDDNVSAEAGIRSRFRTGSIGHELVVHATELRQESGSAVNMSSFASNLYKPVAAAMISLPSSAPRTGDVTLSGLALMDAITLFDERVKLTLGVRQQRVETTSYNASSVVTGSYDKSALTPAASVVLKPWGPAISLYANYVEGLSKGDTVTDTAATNYKQVFAPYKTEQKEVGMKWDAGTFNHAVSLFEITRPMLVTLGSPSSPTYADSGEKRIRGLEWNAAGNLDKAVRLLGGVTYSQGIQTRTAYDQNNGRQAVGVPRWQGNLGMEWDTPWVQGLTLTGRATATSSLYLDAANTQQIAGWSQLDLGARYAASLFGKHTVLRLGVTNVTNRHYYSGSFSDSTPIATLGQARTYTLSASTDF